MIIKIIEPFWGAGSIYGWGSSIPGIGLNAKIVDQAFKNKIKIRVQIGNDPQIYQISPKTIKRLVGKYSSIKEVRFGVQLYVVPQNEFEKEPEYEFIGNKAVLKKSN